MARRKRIGIILLENKQWIAGTYYMLNIINALKTLPMTQQPRIYAIVEDEKRFLKFRDELNYPFFFKILYNDKFRELTGLKRKYFFYKYKMDFIYPRPLPQIKSIGKDVYWIPDFQEDYLPEFFSNSEVIERKTYQQNISEQNIIVVLSSEDAKSDFNRLYPNAKSEVFVLPFAVTHTDFSELEIIDLLAKYNLPDNYYFLPNQFWAHKNHIVVLQALKELKSKNIEVVVAMSGKETDYRNSKNFDNLTTFISNNGLELYVKFLGFIPRDEQLCLFKNSKAIIQPSLFEGWSTVVEDAKALNKFLIVSNITVHKEQLKTNCLFFDPRNPSDLARCIEEFEDKNKIPEMGEYSDNVEKFGIRFMKLVELSLKK